MKRVASALVRIIDLIMDSLAIVAGVLFVIMMIIVLTEVCSRTFANKPIMWVLETTEYIMLFGTFLAAAWLLRREGHVRIDIIFSLLKPKSKAILNIVNSTMLVIVCLALTWFGAVTTVEIFRRGIMEIRQYTIPKFALIAVIPLAGILLSFEAVRKLAGNIRILNTMKNAGEEKDTVSPTS